MKATIIIRSVVKVQIVFSKEQKLVLTSEEFPNILDIVNEAKSNIDTDRKGNCVSIILTEIVIRDQISIKVRDDPQNGSYAEHATCFADFYNFLVSQQPTDGSHLVLVKRKVGSVYYFLIVMAWKLHQNF